MFYTYQSFQIDDEFGVAVPLSPPLTYVRQGPADPVAVLAGIVRRFTEIRARAGDVSTSVIRFEIWIGYDASTDRPPAHSAEIAPVP